MEYGRFFIKQKRTRKEAQMKSQMPRILKERLAEFVGLEIQLNGVTPKTLKARLVFVGDDFMRFEADGKRFDISIAQILSIVEEETSNR